MMDNFGADLLKYLAVVGVAGVVLAAGVGMAIGKFLL